MADHALPSPKGEPFGPANPHPLSTMRTELVWEGKYDAFGRRREIDVPAPAVPLRWTERIDGPRCDAGDAERRHTRRDDFRNRLILGDNKHVAAALLDEFRGRANLVYIDPPFDVGADFTMHLPIGEHDKRNRAARCSVEMVAYRDTWGSGVDSYIHMLYERIVLLRELLAEDGSIYVHCDWRTAGLTRLLMDDVFGAACFQNEICWCYREAINSTRRWNRKHDTLLFYTKDPETFCFNADDVLAPHAESTIRKYKYEDEKGRYRLMGRGIQSSPIRSARDVAPEWERTHPELVYRHYLRDGTYPVDYWQIDVINQAAHERTGFATQKPEALLERIIRASSNQGDLVVDLFCGSGTTGAVAERLGRRWIMADSGPLAIHTSRKRLMTVQRALAVEAQPFRAFDIFTIENENVQSDAVIEAAVVFREPTGAGKRRPVDIRLTRFAPALEHLPEADRDALRDSADDNGLDFIDFWAVDFLPRAGEPFAHHWQDFRTRKDRSLQTESTAAFVYPEPGRCIARVMVVDAFGNASAIDVNVDL